MHHTVNHVFSQISKSQKWWEKRIWWKKKKSGGENVVNSTLHQLSTVLILASTGSCQTHSLRRQDDEIINNCNIAASPRPRNSIITVTIIVIITVTIIVFERGTGGLTVNKPLMKGSASENVPSPQRPHVTGRPRSADTVCVPIVNICAFLLHNPTSVRVCTIVASEWPQPNIRRLPAREFFNCRLARPTSSPPKQQTKRVCLALQDWRRCIGDRGGGHLFVLIDLFQ